MSKRTIFQLLDEIEHQMQHETTTTLKVNDLQRLLNNELIAIVEFNKENGYKTITDTNLMVEVMNNIELLPDIQKALLIIEYYHHSNGWDFDVVAISI